MPGKISRAATEHLAQETAVWLNACRVFLGENGLPLDALERACERYALASIQVTKGTRESAIKGAVTTAAKALSGGDPGKLSEVTEQLEQALRGLDAKKGV